MGEADRINLSQSSYNLPFNVSLEMSDDWDFTGQLGELGGRREEGRAV